VIVTIIGKKLKLKKQTKIKKRICNRIFPFQNISPKIAKKQNKTKLIKPTAMGNQSPLQSILRYHLRFLVMTFFLIKG
jgi:hypothetical protein